MFIYSSTSLYISFSYTSIPCSVTVVLLFFTVSPPKNQIKKDDKNTFADTFKDLSKSLSSFRSATVLIVLNSLNYHYCLSAYSVVNSVLSYFYITVNSLFNFIFTDILLLLTLYIYTVLYRYIINKL
nr:MAG TPA: hypothetical protein [Caudoviricetes sp.]